MTVINEIIEKINNINNKIKQGAPSNPAQFRGDTLVVDGTRKSLEQLREIIGDWSYKQEVEKLESLELERVRLIEFLKNKLK